MKYVLQENGQSLIEVLVGLATAAVIIGAMTAATIAALQNAVFSKNQNLATQYSQQGLELMRSIRDGDYTQFTKLTGTYCFAKSCTTIHSSDECTGGSCQTDACGPKFLQCEQNVGGENADIFVRDVTITPQSTNCISTLADNSTIKSTEVTVQTAWYDSKCGALNIFCHTVKLSSCLSDISAVQ